MAASLDVKNLPLATIRYRIMQKGENYTALYLSPSPMLAIETATIASCLSWGDRESRGKMGEEGGGAGGKERQTDRETDERTDGDGQIDRG